MRDAGGCEPVGKKGKGGFAISIETAKAASSEEMADKASSRLLCRTDLWYQLDLQQGKWTAFPQHQAGSCPYSSHSTCNAQAGAPGAAVSHRGGALQQPVRLWRVPVATCLQAVAVVIRAPAPRAAQVRQGPARCAHGQIPLPTSSRRGAQCNSQCRAGIDPRVYLLHACCRTFHARSAQELFFKRAAACVSVLPAYTAPHSLLPTCLGFTQRGAS